MLQAIYLTCIKLMICNDTRTLYFVYHESRALSYCCDLALLGEFGPIGEQLPLKTVLPLAERIVTALGHCCGTGAHDSIITFIEILVRHFSAPDIPVDAFCVKGGVGYRASAAQGCQWDITWLDAGYAGDVDCDLFCCGYNDRWQCGSDLVEPEWVRSISSHSEAQRGMTRVCDLLCKLCTVFVYSICDHFCFHYDLYIFGNKSFWILNLEWLRPVDL